MADQTSTGDGHDRDPSIPPFAEDGGFDPPAILTEGTLVVIAVVLGGAFLFLVNLFLARRFGPEEFGAFRLVISLYSLLVILVECGAGPTLIRYTPALASAAEVRDLTRKILAFRAAGYLALVAAIVLAREPLTRLVFDDPARVSYTLAGALLVGLVYFDIFRFLVVAHMRMRLYAGSVAATFLANGALALAGGLAGGVVGAVAGWSVGYLVGNLLNLRFALAGGLLRPGEPVAIGRLIVRYGLPMQLQQGVKNLELAIIPLASLFYAAEAIGALALAMVFYRAIMLALTSFQAVLLPRFARLSLDSGQARAALARGAALYTPLVVVGALAALALAEPLIRLVDPAYLGAAPLLRLLLVYALASGYAALVVGYGAGSGRVRLAILVTLLQQGGLVAVSLLGLRALA